MVKNRVLLTCLLCYKLGFGLESNSPLRDGQKPGDGGNVELLLGVAKSGYFHLSDCWSVFNGSQNVDKLLWGAVHTAGTQGSEQSSDLEERYTSDLYLLHL